MTRFQKTLATCALAAGLVAASAGPAMADRIGTFLPSNSETTAPSSTSGQPGVGDGDQQGD